MNAVSGKSVNQLHMNTKDIEVPLLDCVICFREVQTERKETRHRLCCFSFGIRVKFVNVKLKKKKNYDGTHSSFSG